MDDVLIFTNGYGRSLRNLMKLLNEYEQSSGHKLNAAKSRFFLADKFQRRASVIARVMGLTRCALPFNYLGVPITNGRVKTIHYHIIDKVRCVVEGWNAKTLSFEGRLTLIKSVLASFPVYMLSSTIVPKTDLRTMERLMSNFLLDVQGNLRTHWVSWHNITCPITEGGLGITRF